MTRQVFFRSCVAFPRAAAPGTGQGTGFRHAVAHLGLLCLLLLPFADIGAAHAERRPYYVLEQVRLGSLKPRVLLALDTSLSMTWKTYGNESLNITRQCPWNECENPGSVDESRISIARRVLHDLVSRRRDRFDFSLMTFKRGSPPPLSFYGCLRVVAGVQRPYRFIWANQYMIVDSLSGVDTTSNYFGYDIEAYPGFRGKWVPCVHDTERQFGYPYLRWDNLGVGSAVTQNGQSPLPPSPLISTAQSDMKSTVNAERKVQWFPRFMGVKVRLNGTTDPSEETLFATSGDYGRGRGEFTSSYWKTQLRAEVKHHDFYYWPYVDGFPGYDVWYVRNGQPTRAWEGSGGLDPGYEWSSVKILPMGVTNNGLLPRAGLGVSWPPWPMPTEAMLTAPFYLDPTTITAPVPSADRGPASSSVALQQVLDATDRREYGGVGVDTVGTPWRDTVGTIPATAPVSNAYDTHNSIASYIKFLRTHQADDACAPLRVVLVTDGVPSPADQGGPELYHRLAQLRRVLGAKVYVLGIFDNASELHNMACAGAGACDGASCSTPCNDTPANGWDTCASSTSRGTSCAFLAEDGDEMDAALEKILAADTEGRVASGPGTRLADFRGGSPVQTELSAWTEHPGFRGRLHREACDDPDPDNPGQLAPWCDATSAPTVGKRFGPCPASRTWAAEDCLAAHPASQRRLYSHDANNRVYRLNTSTGVASADFVAELTALGLVSAGQAQSEANAVVAFLLGEAFPDNHRLPGLGQATPVVVRRIPRASSAGASQLALRDPHCAGRQIAVEDLTLPPSLMSFSGDAWDAAQMLRQGTSEAHHAYQELVLQGDDMGVLHGFGLDTGNEIFGFLPRALLASAVAQSQLDPSNRGQPTQLDEHLHGISATANQGWVYDASASRWRHLVVFGLGAGGAEFIALDLSHGSPDDPRGPIEVLWTTQDAALRSAFDARLGETWSRPALAYRVPGNDPSVEPSADLVFASGYRGATGVGAQGRYLMRVDALTGQLLESYAEPAISSAGVYDGTTSLPTDLAVGTHCLSRVWPEVQEVFAASTSGRLFRWDIAGDHTADTASRWDAGTVARPIARFLACVGSGTNCSLSSILGDPFHFGPAVSALDRIDENGDSLPPTQDVFLVALASGAPDDTAADRDSALHSSLYLLVDDHRSAAHNGFAIPAGAPVTDPSAIGTHTRYMRLRVSSLSRTRTFTPYPGAAPQSNTRAFHRATRPVRAPRIQVRPVFDSGGAQVPNLEVYEISYTVHEPGSDSCDTAWFENGTGVWHADHGSVYTITLRLTADTTVGFDFSAGANRGELSGDPSFGAQGLSLVSIEQHLDGDCADGVCGPNPGTPGGIPCEGGGGGPDDAALVRGLPLYSTRAPTPR